MHKSYKFPRQRKTKIIKTKMKRWDKKLEGTKCETCNGSGGVFNDRCPRSHPNNHGYPVCHGGVLEFTDYDLRNWNELKRVYK